MKDYKDGITNFSKSIYSGRKKHDAFYSRGLCNYKLKNYNYYKVDRGLPFVEEILTNWRKSDPLVHMGYRTHNKISKINGYSYAYEYNGKFY